MLLGSAVTVLTLLSHSMADYGLKTTGNKTDKTTIHCGLNIYLIVLVAAAAIAVGAVPVVAAAVAVGTVPSQWLDNNNINNNNNNSNCNSNNMTTVNKVQTIALNMFHLEAM